MRRVASKVRITSAVPTKRSRVARVARALDQLGFEYPVVGRQRQCAEGQHRVASADFREPAATLEGRVEDEGDAEQEADMQAADDQAGQRMEGRDDQLVGGKGQRDDR
jgi:hypothetical protein